MRGDEARVVASFCRYLSAEGWSVETEVEFVDVKATKGSVTLYAEAKGRTEAIGVDVDALYGQLLRRVPAEADESILGVVVPELAIPAALRVPTWVRDRLRVHVWSVSDDDRVTLVSAPPDQPATRATAGRPPT